MPLITLVKTSTDTHVAHAYEHMFVGQLRNELQQSGLYNYLDYDVSGFSYKSYILIEIISFTARAEKIMKQILKNFRVPIDEQAITAAICEITAEHGHRFGGDMRQLQNSFRQLDAQPWLAMNELAFQSISTKQKHTLRQLPQAVATRTVTTRVTLNASQPVGRQLPLFHIIATAILSNLQVVMSNNYHYYRQEGRTHYQGKNIYADYSYKVWRRYRPQLTTEHTACTTALQQLINDDFVKLIKHYLAAANYNTPHSAPDIEEVAQATGILIGAHGWRALADKPHIESMLKDITIELRSGGRVQTLKDMT